MSFEELKLMRTPILRNSPSITLYFVLAVYTRAVLALLRGVLPDKHGKQTFSGSWAGRNSRAGRPHLDLPWGYSTSRLKVSCAHCRSGFPGRLLVLCLQSPLWDWAVLVFHLPRALSQSPSISDVATGIANSI